MVHFYSDLHGPLSSFLRWTLPLWLNSLSSGPPHACRLSFSGEPTHSLGWTQVDPLTRLDPACNWIWCDRTLHSRGPSHLDEPSGGPSHSSYPSLWWTPSLGWTPSLKGSHCTHPNLFRGHLQSTCSGRSFNITASSQTLQEPLKELFCLYLVRLVLQDGG